jgi:cytochrome c553
MIVKTTMIKKKRIIALLCTLLLVAAAAPAAQEETSLDLINSSGCKGCHRIADEGATLAPALTRRETPLSTAEIINRLSAGSNKDDAFMPAYHWLTDEQQQAIARYLSHLQK